MKNVFSRKNRTREANETNRQNKEPLWHEIKDFNKNKWAFGSGLIFIGTISLLVPVMPGVLLILLGAAFFAPHKVKDLITRIKPN